MLNFLKNLFQKEELVTIEEVKEIELEDWLNHKISQIDFREEIAAFYNQIKDKKWILDEKVEILENTELDDKEKVEEKIKNIVLGHKDNYIKATRQFMENLTIPEEENLTEALLFSQDLNQALDNLSQRTAKSYQAAQHLFFNQVEDVFNNLGSLNSNVLDFNKKLERLGAFKITKLKEKINQLNGVKKKGKVLEKEIGWKQEKLDRCLKGKSKQKNEIVRLKDSEDYAEFKILNEKEEKINNVINDNRDEVFLFFSKLDRVLRKYERITLHPDIIKRYLDNPVESFFDDDKLQMVDILVNLEKSIGKKDIDLDEKKRITILDSIRKAKKGYLQEILERGNELQNKMEEIKSKLRRYNVDRQIEEAEYKLEHFDEQITMVNREIEEWNFKLNSLDRTNLQKEIIGSINNIFKIEVKLS
tara:strand:- start:2 stop:1255 length:1254 start_codon:yes stop_codon:yes gene_type:complete